MTRTKSHSYVKAARLARKKILEGSGGEKNPLKCNPPRCTSIDILDESKYLQYETMIRNILREQEETLGTHDPETLSTLNILSVLLNKMKMVEESRMICHRVIDACSAAEGNVDRVKSYSACMSTAQNNLGCALATEGTDVADALIRDARVSRNKIFHGSDVHSHNILHNLANIEFMKSDHHAASLLYRDALHHRAFISEHKSFQTCDTESSLADSLYRLGDFVGAETIYRQLLCNLNSLVGVGHTYSIPFQKRLVSTLIQQQRYAEAELVLRDLLYAFESRIDSNMAGNCFTSDVWKVKSQIAELLCKQKKNIQAEAMYTEALVGNDPETIDGYVQCLIQLDKIQEAVKFYGTILEQRNSTLGSDHPLTVHALCVYADLHIRSGEAEDAMRYNLKALDVYKKELGSDHFLTLSVINNIGRTYEMMNRTGEAEKQYIQAIEGFEEILGNIIQSI